MNVLISSMKKCFGTLAENDAMILEIKEKLDWRAAEEAQAVVQIHFPSKLENQQQAGERSENQGEDQKNQKKGSQYRQNLCKNLFFL